MEEALLAYRGLAAGWYDDLLSKETDEELVQAFTAMMTPEDGGPGEDLGFLDARMRVRFARDLRESLTTYEGIAHDNIAVGRTWDIDLTAIRQPTFLWYGEVDTAVSSDHAHWWQDHIPQAQLTIRPGRGHGGAFLLHWAHMLRDLA